MSSNSSPAHDPDYKHAAFAFYRYEPTMAGAIIFAVLFFLSTVLHMVQMIKTRTWYLIAFVLGGWFEFIGYAGRAGSAAQDPGYWTLTPYIIQSIFLLVAPALFAASIYMVLGRIILLTDADSRSIIKRRFLTKLFVCGDVLSFLMQASGGGMMAMAAHGNPDSAKTGEHVIIGGLFVQLFFFGFFILVAAVFHIRLGRNPTAQAQNPAVQWQKYLMTLYVVSVLIMIRSIFRVIEYIMGNDGFLMTTEVFLYVFDALLMFGVCVWMNWDHPSAIGLLLRGEKPAGSGFKIVTSRPTKQEVVTLTEV